MMATPARALTVWRGLAGWLAVAAALQSGGCVLNGDFGRLREELVAENMHDWVGRDAVVGIGGPVSEFRTTDLERELRDRAFALIEPPYNRNRWDSVWREYGLGHDPDKPPVFDKTEYLARLHRVHRRSEASAYAQIVTDARNDVERLQPFFAAAVRVTDMDRRRSESLAHIKNLNPRERINVVARNRENAAIIAWVCRAVKDRVAAYRYAVERLVIAVPNLDAAGADRSVSLLATRLGQYCNGVDGATVAVRG